MGSFGDHFGIVLGSFWNRFGIVLGSFWDHFGIVLGSCWDRFGIIFALFLGNFFLRVGGMGEALKFLSIFPTLSGPMYHLLAVLEAVQDSLTRPGGMRGALRITPCGEPPHFDMSVCRCISMHEGK